MKRCTTCKCEKSLNEFSRCTKVKDGRKSSCKVCERQYRLGNAERLKAKAVQYYADNKEARKQYNTDNKETIREKKLFRERTHPENYIHMKSKHSAKERNLAHTISPEDITIPDKCPYLDTPLTRIQDSGIIQTNPSIDRIDNTKGYIKGNIQIISRLANTIKSSATEEQLITFATNVLRLHES